MPTEPFTLAPAKWIWLDGERTLPGTFLLFRREFDLDELPSEAGGWILADSRYRLWANGRRVQWGPAPADPRHLEADPVDLKPYLQKGKNVIGVEVLFYGQGDGTWPLGKPGLIARLQAGNQNLDTIAATWRVHLDRARKPGRAKRAFLRALQEEFDSRLHPHGWSKPGFTEDATWHIPRELRLPAERTPFSGGHSNYGEDFYAPASTPTDVAPRSIPLMREEIVRATARPARVPSYGGSRMPLSTSLADRVRGFLADPTQWRRFPPPTCASGWRSRRAVRSCPAPASSWSRPSRARAAITWSPTASKGGTRTSRSAC